MQVIEKKRANLVCLDGHLNWSKEKQNKSWKMFLFWTTFKIYYEIHPFQGSECFSP